MIVESLVSFFLNLLTTLFSGIQLVSLPTDLIATLATITAYGNWVVGLDVLALFVSSVVFWWVFHMSIGLIVWVWDRLPLT